MRTLLGLLLLFSLTACAIGPDYQRPSVTIPGGWRIESPDAQSVANTTWWGQFNDQVLNDLIQTALKENYDLKIATARVEEYVGRYWVGRSGLFPQIYAGGGGGQQRSSERLATPIPSSINNPSTLYQGAFSGSWEIDVWGRHQKTHRGS